MCACVRLCVASSLAGDLRNGSWGQAVDLLASTFMQNLMSCELIGQRVSIGGGTK